MDKARDRIEGFSLIELLIAMTVTLIMGGAIVGLLVSANRSFRREPEVAERQQNMRAAMDMIMRDVANAGSGAPAFTQTFTQNLDAFGDDGPFGEKTDDLEILSNPNGNDSTGTCSDDGSNTRLWDLGTDIQVGDTVMVLLKNPPGTYVLRVVTQKNTDEGGPKECVAGQKHDRLIFDKGPKLCDPPGNVPATFPQNACQSYAVVRVVPVRYQVRKEDVTNFPVLERVSNGRTQVVARGIEDMQVTYRQASDLGKSPESFSPNPALVVLGDPNTLTVEVEVQLSARTQQGNLDYAARASAGAAADTAAIRGRLVSRAAPRTALFMLASQSNGLWR